MDARELTRPDPVAAPIGESRSRVLAVLQDAGEPLGVGDVAKRIRLHPNTVRFHLDALVKAGLVERTMEEREQPGRPRALYAAHPGSSRAGHRSYRLLAAVLASYIAAQTPQPEQAVAQAGQAWGRYLTERPPPLRRIDADAAIEQLVRTLAEIGFAPEAVTSGKTRQVLLHHCPFSEIAAEYGEVVCSVHLGLMQGLLAELDAPIDAERLDPFVEPNVCIAHLTANPENSTKRGTSRRRS